MGKVRDLISKYTDRTNKLQSEAERRQYPSNAPSRSQQATHVRLIPYASASTRQTTAATSPPRVSPLRLKGSRKGLRLARGNAASTSMGSPFRLQSIKLSKSMLPQNTLRRRARNKAYARPAGDRKVTLHVEQLPAPVSWEGVESSVLQRSRVHSTNRGKLVQLHTSTNSSNSRGRTLGRAQAVQQQMQLTKVRDTRKTNEGPRRKGNHTLQRIKALRPSSAKAAQRHLSKVNRSGNAGPQFLFASRQLPIPQVMARSRTPTNQSEGSARYSTLGRKAMTARSHTSPSISSGKHSTLGRKSGKQSRLSRRAGGIAAGAVKQTASQGFRKGEAVGGIVRRTASVGLTRSFKVGSEAANQALSMDLSRTLPRSMQRQRTHASTGDVIMASMGKETLRGTLQTFLAEKDPELYGADSTKSLQDVRRHVEYLCETYDFPDLANAVRTKYMALPRTWDMELVRLGESDIDVLL